MVFELPVPWVVTLNVVLWPLIQLGLAWGFTRLPVAWFERAEPAAGGDPRPYERWFRIRAWKDRLPDGARWVGGGFAKRSMASAEPAYLRRFIAETRRGECCHACALGFVPLFLLWNPWWGVMIITLYAVSANVPCMLAQRYNRIRLRGLLERAEARRCQSAAK